MTEQQTDEIKIKLQNCNNIDSAEISIQKNSLNIKYGPNGLGKSTIAKAIVASAADDDSLETLMPFKQLATKTPLAPSIEGAESITKVNLFDDRYVNQFVFKTDEVVDGSFEIFIRTDEYKTAMNEVEELFAGIKNAFEKNEEIEEAISDLKELMGAFDFTAKGVLSKASKGYKAISKGNKIKHIPPKFLPFKEFLKSNAPAKWITWQKKGNEFLDLSDNCPYCSSDLSDEGKKETAQQVAEEYDSKGVENLNSLQSVIGKLGKYFTKDSYDSLLQIIEGKTELTEPEEAFIKTMSFEISALTAKLEALKNISFFSLRDMEVEKIENYLNTLNINLKMINKMNSEDTQKVVNPINDRLKELVDQVGILKGKINIQKDRIKATIERNQEQINDFLQSAGYRYKVEIVPEHESYKMKLIHLDHNKHIENASNHLSYGEKNAFSLILFMYQAIRECPDLIILDDPISSFDKNKKFAILHKLFRGRQSFRGMTILMLTHDIEPAIDMIRVSGIRGQFQALKPSASFLSSSNGVIKEVEISREDIQTFTKICEQNIKDAPNDIIKIIYLRRRYEILDNFGDEYNLLASLLHKRDSPKIKQHAGEIDMTPQQIKKAEDSIAIHIPNFQYSNMLSQVRNTEEIIRNFMSASSGYEKIQLFRIANDDNADNHVITKFVNETFHIENEYVMQLNPQKFDSIPEYIVKECERILTPE